MTRSSPCSRPARKTSCERSCSSSDEAPRRSFSSASSPCSWPGSRPRPPRPRRAATSFRQIGSGFDQPVHVTTPKGVTDRLYVVEQPGRIRIVRGGRVVGTLLDIRSRVVCCGEQGLLSVAFHPNYAKNKRFFVYYTAPANRVVEYRGSRAVRTLLNVQDPYSNHNGGQLMFGPDGRLYVGMGDGGAGGDPENRAQNLGVPLRQAARDRRRQARRALAGRRLRPPEPLALLVRPQDRRPLHRRRRPELLGGGRLHPPPQPGARELRLGRLRGPRRGTRARRGTRVAASSSRSRRTR